MGIPYGEARQVLEETVAILRELVSGRTVTSREGRFKLAGVQLAVGPVQDGLPIYLGAIGSKALRLAGAVADGVLLNAYTPSRYVRWAVEEVRQAARDAGRDPGSVDIACMLVVRPTEDPQAIWPSLKERIVRLLAEAHVGELLLEKGGFDPDILGRLRRSVAEGRGSEAVGLITDEMVDAFYLVGPASRIAERVAEYREAGVDLPLLLPRLEDFDQVAAIG
jgi:5,10-methylenetetrahydromethanopterin reductase